MKKMIRNAALFVAALVPYIASAQEMGSTGSPAKVETTLQADIVSSYVWRGQNLGSGAVQPTLGIEYRGLSLCAWGSYGFVNTDDAKEIDLSLTYSIKGFTVGITDYFIASGESDCPDKYFRYKGDGENEQVHVFEASLGYDFGFMAVNWYTNFAGADKDYSSYFDFTVPFRLGVDWEFNAGFSPYRSAGNYCNRNFACVNLSLKASKDIRITDHFSLPVFGQLTANPDNGKLYLAFGLSLGI